MHKLNPTILRAYDIRGIVAETLHNEDAYHIARSFATKVAANFAGNIDSIVVGFDGRLSSPDLAKNIINGLKDSGVKVYDIGVGPTPLVYFAVKFLKATAGIMITGSHNPPNHNGFKFLLKDRPFYGDDITNLGAIAESGKYLSGQGEVIKKDLNPDYIKMLLNKLSFAPKNLTIAWDPGNGAAGFVVEELTKLMPGKHILLNSKIDGTFPAHHPDPSDKENLIELIDIVKKEKCDLGIAFDGDGDRIGVIDRSGRVIEGDQLVTILSSSIIKAKAKAKIIFDIKSSQFLIDFITQKGGTPILWKSGHSLIKAKMKEENAQMAGEVSGHIFFADNHNFDDGIYAAVKVINLFAEKDLSLFYDELPVSFVTPEIRIDVIEEEKFGIITNIKQKLKEKNIPYSDIDGVRVSSSLGWWLLRASNTQSCLVMRCEAKNQQDLDILIKECRGYL